MIPQLVLNRVRAAILDASRYLRPRGWAIAFAGPAVLLVLITTLVPVIAAVLYSFKKAVLIRPDFDHWLGTANYVRAYHDPVAWEALAKSFQFCISAVAMELSLGLISAHLLNKGLRGTKLFCVLIFLPYFLPSVVAGNIWALILDNDVGIASKLLAGSGVTSVPPLWFANSRLALTTVSFVEAWHGFPFFTFIFLAALKSVPVELLEAASLDGAGRMSRIFYIIAPEILPVVILATVVRMVLLLNSADMFLVLTNGGPGRSTEVLSLYAFKVAFNDFDFGYSSTLSMILALSITLLAFPLASIAFMARR